MKCQAIKTEFREIEKFRELHRADANCQIVSDSKLPRGIADSYLLLLDGSPVGYGGVGNRYDVGRICEFYVLPGLQRFAKNLFEEFLAASEANSIEAQTNLRLILLMAYEFAHDIAAENFIFEDRFETHLESTEVEFRAAIPADELALTDWVLARDSRPVANGGYLCHYNPPYGDVFMNVDEQYRRRGYGSLLVQEIKKVCYAAGYRPAARCNGNNVGSRKTLEAAGMLPCGRILVGHFR